MGMSSFFFYDIIIIGIDPILNFLRVPDEVWDGMKSYLLVIFAGIIATSLYNYFSCLLRALGNSTIPLVFLAVSAIPFSSVRILPRSQKTRHVRYPDRDIPGNTRCLRLSPLQLYR